MNNQRKAIFESDETITETFKEKIKEIWQKPTKLFLFLFLIVIQISLSLFCIVSSVLLPYWILYG